MGRMDDSLGQCWLLLQNSEPSWKNKQTPPPQKKQQKTEQLSETLSLPVKAWRTPSFSRLRPAVCFGSVGLCHTLDIIFKHGFLDLINSRAPRGSLESSVNINHLPECVLSFGLGNWPEMEQGQGGDVVVYWLGVPPCSHLLPATRGWERCMAFAELPLQDFESSWKIKISYILEFALPCECDIKRPRRNACVCPFSSVWICLTV